MGRLIRGGRVEAACAREGRHPSTSTKHPTVVARQLPTAARNGNKIPTARLPTRHDVTALTFFVCPSFYCRVFVRYGVWCGVVFGLVRCSRGRPQGVPAPRTRRRRTEQGFRHQGAPGYHDQHPQAGSHWHHPPRAPAARGTQGMYEGKMKPKTP